MISPYTSFAWHPYAGQYGIPMVRILCDVANAGRFAAPHAAARGEGRRAVLFQNCEKRGHLFDHPDDRLQGRYRGLWTDAGVAATKADFGRVVDQFLAAKGKIDLAVFDIETATNPFVLNADDLAAIHADPRYAALVAKGLFPADCRTLSQAEVPLFNYGCWVVRNDVIVKAIIEPLRARFPGVPWVDFSDQPITKADARLAPDANGHALFYAPSSATYYSPVVYGYIDLLGKQDKRFKESFYVMALNLNWIRATYRAKAGAKVLPWTAPRSISNVWDNDWWRETILHTCCLAGLNHLYFNADNATSVANWRYDTLLAEFVGRARGKLWKNPLTTDLTNYDTATGIVSACKLADNTVLGRVTFKPGVNRVTTTVAGKTYTVNRTGKALGEWFRS